MTTSGTSGVEACMFSWGLPCPTHSSCNRPPDRSPTRQPEARTFHCFGSASSPTACCDCLFAARIGPRTICSRCAGKVPKSPPSALPRVSAASPAAASKLPSLTSTITQSSTLPPTRPRVCLSNCCPEMPSATEADAMPDPLHPSAPPPFLRRIPQLPMQGGVRGRTVSCMPRLLLIMDSVGQTAPLASSLAAGHCQPPLTAA